MSDTRTHRGPHPRDAEAFGAENLARLQTATGELSWLLSRGYTNPSALKLVGDRHGLILRQRDAVLRCSCSDSALAARAERRRDDCAGEHLSLDGLNVLLTAEIALGGGVVLLGRDGCARDLGSVHGTYRRVEETQPGIELVGGVLCEVGVRSVCVVLDEPVSNTRKLAGMIRETWASSFELEIRLEYNADRALIESGGLVASADAGVLDRCGGWVNLARRVVERVDRAWVLDLGEPVAQNS